MTMKRKKWSEAEERTLLSKYSDLRTCGTLGKLKTREKKFKPIADHVNSVHYNQDPLRFPFKWSWRDVSIKVQNMRHQYIGVKQKISVSEDDFNWKDGENHWENFLRYKLVFGDVELDTKWKRASKNVEAPESCDGGDDVFGLGFGVNADDLEESGDDDGDGNGCGDNGPGDGFGIYRVKKRKNGGHLSSLKVEENQRRMAFTGAQVLELRDLILRRDEKSKEREWSREMAELDREERKIHADWRREWEERLDRRELELEESSILLARREMEKRLRLEMEFAEERHQRLKLEEKREEEEMEWKERMVGFQIEHEKQMMQLYEEACQHQMQILGVMAGIVCQFFEAENDGMGGELASLPPQVLQDLQNSSGLGDAVKPDANSPSDFM